jgi:SAM-dependent methyltransferase
MKESLDYYNQFDKKLIKDYASGNKRIVSAIENLAAYIPTGEGLNVLDIGCGLGWSTFEFSRFFKDISFEGVDLSPVLIDKAKKLFQNENLNYQVFDITISIPNKQYDAIVMIDVYEHIPAEERNKFHQSLKELLKPNGRILMACPSVFHQEYLKKNNPEGLQPIDEDVSLKELQQAAVGVRGEVIYFEYQNIWRNFDYLYAVIQKGVSYDLNRTLKINNNFKVENQNIRIKKIKDKLDVVYESKKSINILRKTIKKIKKKIYKSK